MVYPVYYYFLFCVAALYVGLTIPQGLSPDFIKELNEKVSHSVKEKRSHYEDPLGDNDEDDPAGIFKGLFGAIEDFGKKQGKMTIEGRELTYKTRYRLHSLDDGWVYDCRIKDIASGVVVEVRHRKDELQVIKEAVQKLFQELESRELYLPEKEEPTEEGDSPPNDDSAPLNNSEGIPDAVPDPPPDRENHEDEKDLWPMFFRQYLPPNPEILLYRLVLCLAFILAVNHIFRRKSSHFLQTNVTRLLVDDIEPDGDGLYKHLVISAATPTVDQLDGVRNYDSMYRSPKKGVAYILNNDLFYKRRPGTAGRERKGSEVDLENVQYLFTQLGYETTIDENVTADRIRSNLDSLVKRINQEGAKVHSSLVLFLMSHGTPHGILGTDELEISIEEIMGRLSGKNCQALVEKPKIVFIQACRGQNLQQSAVDGELPQIDTDEEPAECLRRRGVATDDAVFPSRGTPLNQSLEVDYIPDNTDIYVAYATSFGYFSVRDTVKGSWFVQATCEEFIARAHIDDLDTMMESVTRRVTKLWGKMKLRSGQEVTMLQTPDIRKQGVRRKIYFAPQYPTSGSAKIR